MQSWVLLSDPVELRGKGAQLRTEPLDVYKTGRPPKIYTVPQVTCTPTEPGRYQLSVKLDVDDEWKLGEIVNKAIVRRGGKLLSSDEQAMLKVTRGHRDRPLIQGDLAIDTVHYKRGLAKIAYELACHWLGEGYVDDPLAAEWRRFIFDQDLHRRTANDYALQGASRFAGKQRLLPLWESETHHLIGAAVRAGPSISIYVRTLGAFDALHLVTNQAAVYVGEAENLPVISIDPTTGEQRSSRFLDDALRAFEDDNGEVSPG